MREKITKENANRRKGNEHPLAWPHCSAGAKGLTIGLFWDYYDQCWRCIMCGYLGYEHAARPKSKTEILAERICNQILDNLDKEENGANSISMKCDYGSPFQIDKNYQKIKDQIQECKQEIRGYLMIS